MNERTRHILVYGSLVLAVCYAAYSYGGGSTLITSRPEELVAPPPDSALAVAPVLQEQDVQKLRAAAWGRDPFVTSKRTTTTRPGLTWSLRGIVYHPTRPLAYINGTRVKVGDMINSARVEKIERTKVTLTYQGNQFDVYVEKG